MNEFFSCLVDSYMGFCVGYTTMVLILRFADYVERRIERKDENSNQ